MGPLIKQVTDRLPPEKRKGYLLSPRANLTYDSLMESILGKDGITPEMIKGQQERVQFLERLMQVTTKDVRTELIQQNEKIIDEQFPLSRSLVFWGKVSYNKSSIGASGSRVGQHKLQP